MQAALFSPTTTAKSKPVFSVVAEGREAAAEISRLFHSQQATAFGDVLIVSTGQGICELHFGTPAEILTLLKSKFPKALLEENSLPEHQLAADSISGKSTSDQALWLHLFGTPFQLQIWQKLLEIPAGTTCTYGELAKALDLPVSASRAVGTAVGQNAIAVLVPCHRVVGSTGKLTGFRWGVERKKQLLLAEQS